MHPYLKILDPASLFVADALQEKKIKKFSFTPLSEHFEIWVWKPATWARGLIQFARVCVPDGVHDGGTELVGLEAGLSDGDLNINFPQNWRIKTKSSWSRSVLENLSKIIQFQ